MTKTLTKIALILLLPCFAFSVEVKKVEKAPSKDKIQWMGSETTLESTFRYDYVGAGKTDFGNNTHGDLGESDVLIRQLITRRFKRALLVRGGIEWERFDFVRSDAALIPGNLNEMSGFFALDFRFSRKSMVRIQGRPGFYLENGIPDGRDMNCPYAVAYTRIVSRDLQWSVGVSISQWRDRPYLGGGGLRWRINDKWRLKMMLPEPQIEYKAREDLHLFVGGDFRGDSFRVSENFGTKRGRPDLDNALVDYQELRANMGFSWNIRPLLEFNMATGYVLDRSFHYHNNGLRLTSEPSPYISVTFQWLFEFDKDFVDPAAEAEIKQFDTPNLERVLPNVPKIFNK